MTLQIRQYPKVAVTAAAYILFVVGALVSVYEPDRARNQTMVGGPGVKPGLASDAAVLFGYTTHPLELAPESNPDLFVRTEASSCLRPREPT